LKFSNRSFLVFAIGLGFLFAAPLVAAQGFYSLSVSPECEEGTCELSVVLNSSTGLQLYDIELAVPEGWKIDSFEFDSILGSLCDEDGQTVVSQSETAIRLKVDDCRAFYPSKQVVAVSIEIFTVTISGEGSGKPAVTIWEFYDQTRPIPKLIPQALFAIAIADLPE
jgi:hypothetical protein